MAFPGFMWLPMASVAMGGDKKPWEATRSYGKPFLGASHDFPWAPVASKTLLKPHTLF